MKRITRPVSLYLNFLNYRRSSKNNFGVDIKKFGLPSELGKVLIERGLEKKVGIRLVPNYNNTIISESLADSIKSDTHDKMNSWNREKSVENRKLKNISNVPKNISNVPKNISSIIKSNEKRKKCVDYLNEYDELVRHYSHQGKKIDGEGKVVDGQHSTRVEVAKFIGLSHSQIWKLQQIQKIKPELLDVIDSGERSINNCWKMCKNKKMPINNKVFVIEKDDVPDFVPDFVDNDQSTFDNFLNDYITLRGIGDKMTDILKNQLFEIFIERKKFVDNVVSDFTKFVSEKI